MSRLRSPRQDAPSSTPPTLPAQIRSVCLLLLSEDCLRSVLRPLFTYLYTCVYLSFDFNHDTSRVTCVPGPVLSPLISLLEFCLLCMFMYIFTGVFTYVYACFDLRLVICRGTAFLTPFCNSSFVIGISFTMYSYVYVNAVLRMFRFSLRVTSVMSVFLFSFVPFSVFYFSFFL